VRVIWSPAALNEIARASEYLMVFNPRAATRLAEGLIAAGDDLINFPYRGRIVPRTGLRELITNYPYIIRYRIVGADVRILRVRHTARRPTNP
jgi:toxin ParE1/3/4